MATTKVILTNYGNAKVLEAIANDTTVSISALVYGDGNGATYEPQPTQTDLVHQIGAITVLSRVFNQDDGFIYFSGTIEASSAEFTIRELGLVDASNTLLAVATIPPTSKPSTSDGLEVSLPLSIGFKTSIGSVLIVDHDTSDYASKAWVLDEFQLLSEKAQPDGYAPLNGDAILPAEHSLIRYSVLGNTTYQGGPAKEVLLRKEDDVPIIPYVPIDLSSYANISFNNITTAAYQVIGTRALQNFPIVEKTWASTIDLSDNCINYIANLSGNTTLRVPNVTDNSVLHQILVLLRMSTVRTVYHRNMNNQAIGNFYNETPDMSEAGYYTLIYEYSRSKWYVGSIYKGT